MTRIRANTSGRQHVGKGDALPGGVANRLRAPEQLAGDRSDAGKLTAAIARAFERRGGCASWEALAQIVEREAERRPHHPGDGQRPLFWPHHWQGAVVAHKEQLIGGDECAAQVVERWAGVERALLQDAQCGLLLELTHGVLPLLTWVVPAQRCYLATRAT